MTATNHSHSKLGPSKAYRWMNCPGSVKAEESYENQDTFQSAEGTLCHTYAELLFERAPARERRQVLQVLDALYEEEGYGELQAVTAAKALMTAAEQYVIHCTTVSDNVQTVGVELRVSLEPWVAGAWGTADWVGYDPDTHTLYIRDLKYGRLLVPVGKRLGDWVQGALYAGGAVYELDATYDIERVNVGVFQPRAGNVDHIEAPVDELWEWLEFEVKPSALIARMPGAPRVAGSHCQWCLARADCPQLRHYTMEGMTDTSEHLHDLLERAHAAEIWAKAIKERALNAALDGQKIEGYKLVRKRSNARWVDTEQADEKLRSIAGNQLPGLYNPQTLRTPTQVAKELGITVDDLGELVERPTGAPVLVRETDKRDAIGADASEGMIDSPTTQPEKEKT